MSRRKRVILLRKVSANPFAFKEKVCVLNNDFSNLIQIKMEILHECNDMQYE